MFARCATALLMVFAVVEPTTGQVTNGGFEHRSVRGFAQGWQRVEYGYAVSLDSTVSYEGGASVRAVLVGDPQAPAAFFQRLDPAEFAGQRVSIVAQVRTAAVSVGGAGLFIRADGPTGPLVYDAMPSRRAGGTSDWDDLELVADIPETASTILVGGQFRGTGEAWFDALEIKSLGPAFNDAPDPHDDARAYLVEALDSIAAAGLFVDSVDWQGVRASAIASAATALDLEETYSAIGRGLRALGDRHSFFMNPIAYQQRLDGPRASLPDAFAVEKRGSVIVAQIGGVAGGTPERLASLVERTHEAIIGSADSTPATCGWVVDLRANTGGNMWPMLAALLPLFPPQSPAGFFLDKRGQKTPWFTRPGSAGYGEHESISYRPNSALQGFGGPVAVLIGPETASSGEAIAVALGGLPNTLLIGKPTRGLTTGNRTIRLRDGAVMAVTSSVFADRDGRPFGGPVMPGHAMAGDADSLDVALEWLARAAGCASDPRDET